MILSLGEDRCEGEDDKVFTRSALIKSDLWRAGEGVKAKKENQLRRAYVRAPQLVFFFRLHPFTRPPQITLNQRTTGEDFVIFSFTPIFSERQNHK